MKKVSAFLSAALLVGGLTLGALFPEAAGAAEEAELQGTITKLDPATGRVELKTEKGPVQIYIDSDEVKEFKEGDKVEIDVELEKVTK
jgi:Cu/Ag efflux protein CusF